MSMQPNIVTGREKSLQQAWEGHPLKVETEKLSCKVGYLLNNLSLASATQLGAQGSHWNLQGEKKKTKTCVLDYL